MISYFSNFNKIVVVVVVDLHLTLSYGNNYRINFSNNQFSNGILEGGGGMLDLH